MIFPGLSIMLDSGAYSAWKRGTEVNLRNYIAFISDNLDLWEFYVALDCIPGNWGTSLTPAKVEAAAAQSSQNYGKMLQAGLKPIPVYHLGEDIKWLKRMVDSGADYIGLGGLVGKATDKARHWLDAAFNYLSGFPKVRVHGFGISNTVRMREYPWYSIDSSSFMRQAAYGFIRLPWDGWKKLAMVWVSTKFGMGDKDFSGGIEFRSAVERERIEEKIKEVSPRYTLKILQEDKYARGAFNMLVVDKFCSEHLTPVKDNHTGLFDFVPRRFEGGNRAIKFYVVCWFNEMYIKQFTELPYARRLYSYDAFLTGKLRIKDAEEHIKRTLLVGEKTNESPRTDERNRVGKQRIKK
jgi:hypothetical protein